MRQIRQALRLHLEAGLSYAQVARAVGAAKGTVGKFVPLARAAGVDWAVALALADEETRPRWRKRRRHAPAGGALPGAEAHPCGDPPLRRGTARAAGRDQSG